MTIAECLFWLSVLPIAYSYVLYPAAVWLAARLLGRPTAAPPTPSEDLWPRVSLLVAAYNEEQTIGQRIRNALASEYPADRVEVLIGSDGSTDRTSHIVAGFKDPRVRLIELHDRGGKASVLNRLAAEATGEALVFSDANTHFDPPAIRELVRALLPAKVTAVCGRLVLTDGAGVANVDGLYWRYESAIKRAEGRLGAVLGANGGIYALRRRHFVPLPAGTIIDDFVEPLLAKLRHGGSIVYCPAAVAREPTPAGIGDEFARRARIGAGNYQSLAMLWPLLWPSHGWSALAFFSHKLLRWTTPLLMVVALLANAALIASPVYAWLLGGQLAFYGGAAVGAATRGGGAAGKLLRLATMFTGMNLALGVGFWRWLTGAASGVWGRTSREQDATHDAAG